MLTAIQIGCIVLYMNTTTAQDLQIGDVTEFGTVAEFGIQASGRSMRLVQFTDGSWKKFRATTKIALRG